MKNCLKLCNGDVIKTLGYYVVNDGGGAEYRVRVANSEDEDNAFTLELANGLIAELIINGQVNVKSLGANDNGDCSDIISICMSKGYYNLYFPDGTYHIDQDIALPEVYFKLDGRATIVGNDNVSCLLNVNPKSTERKQNMYIERWCVRRKWRRNCCWVV